MHGCGIHGLNCCHSEGRHHRHGTVNSIIHKALISAKIPLQLEPAGLFRSDSKSPDGRTIIPWSCGQLPVRDATCPDTIAKSYQGQATTGAGKVAAAAEEKTNKFSNLDLAYLFMPFAIDTYGPFGPQSLAFVKELWSRIHHAKDWRGDSNNYLMQRLSMPIQKGIVAAVLGSLGHACDNDWLLFTFLHSQIP